MQSNQVRIRIASNIVMKQPEWASFQHTEERKCLMCEAALQSHGSEKISAWEKLSDVQLHIGVFLDRPISLGKIWISSSSACRANGSVFTCWSAAWGQKKLRISALYEQELVDNHLKPYRLQLQFDFVTRAKNSWLDAGTSCNLTFDQNTKDKRATGFWEPIKSFCLSFQKVQAAALWANIRKRTCSWQLNLVLAESLVINHHRYCCVT